MKDRVGNGFFKTKGYAWHFIKPSIQFNLREPRLTNRRMQPIKRRMHMPVTQKITECEFSRQPNSTK